MTMLKEAQVEGLYLRLSDITCLTPEVLHFDHFEIKDGTLY